MTHTVDDLPPDVAARTFRSLLVNSLIAGVTTSFLWFALTFWVFVETRSVVATSVIGASYSIVGAIVGVPLGSYVDRHRKHRAMALSTTLTLGCYVVAATLYVLAGPADLLDLRNPLFWIVALFTLGGSVAGTMRSIALSTCVTLLVPEDRRAKANGQIGTVVGAAFAVTAVFSGLVIGNLGMGWAFALALVLTAAALAHLYTIDIPEELPATHETRSRTDLRGTLAVVHSVPGLMMLIMFAAFNNLLGGVFISLMDAYGLSLVSVEAWGFIWGFLSLAFIAGGLIVARKGLGSQPLRLLVICNLVNYTMCTVFALRSSIWLLAAGMFVWLILMPVAEAAEQTVLQSTVPFEKQGSVFGFALTIENAASPVTALMIGPLAEEFFIPFMTDGAGADTIGSWFGTGYVRGLALVFTLAGLVGLAATLLVRFSRSYRALNDRMTRQPAPVG
jgi:DHA3 family multidrug efflux protein-like MFS transporter